MAAAIAVAILVISISYRTERSEFIGRWSGSEESASITFNKDGTYLEVNMLRYRKGTWRVSKEKLYLMPLSEEYFVQYYDLPGTMALVAAPIGVNYLPGIEEEHPYSFSSYGEYLRIDTGNDFIGYWKLE